VMFDWFVSCLSNCKPKSDIWNYFTKSKVCNGACNK